MHKIFNVAGDCKPKIHYMVDITGKLQRIKEMVDAGQYFTINRARNMEKQRPFTLWRNIYRKSTWY